MTLSTHMPTSSSVSKHFSSSSDLASALSACNAVFERDFGPGHVLDADCAPEILLMAKDESGTVNGVVGLHFHEESCAWELGTVSASVPRSHSPLMGFLLEKEAPVAIRRWYGEVLIFLSCLSSAFSHIQLFQGDAWLVKRLKQKNTRLQTSMKSIGFELPVHFMVGVLEDKGYVPFDPLDEVLMKKKIVFAVDP